MAEAHSVASIANANPDWPLKQVLFVGFAADDLDAQLDTIQKLHYVVGRRQSAGRSGDWLVRYANELHAARNA